MHFTLQVEVESVLSAVSQATLHASALIPATLRAVAAGAGDAAGVAAARATRATAEDSVAGAVAGGAAAAAVDGVTAAAEVVVAVDGAAEETRPPRGPPRKATLTTADGELLPHLPTHPNRSLRRLTIVGTLLHPIRLPQRLRNPLNRRLVRSFHYRTFSRTLLLHIVSKPPTASRFLYTIFAN